MELEIQIVRDPCHELAKPRLRVFNKSGGIIGRSPDNYWSLPDPKCYVSGRHCEVEYRGDGFWLRDTSRNGVFVNDSTERVGYGHRVRLDDGDRLRLGLYELVVRLRDHGRLVDRGVSGQAERNAGLRLRDDEAARTVDLSLASIDDVAHVPTSVRPVAADELHSEPELTLSTTGSHRVIKFDHAMFRENGLLPPESQKRLIANQFRQIKRSLIANAFGRGIPAVANGRLLMITSAMPGEGKTFSTINLALSMAREKDVEVLLVDADVAKPHVSTLFKLEKERGLLDVLVDEAIDIESLVLRTDVKGLCVLPAGRCSEDLATELFASARMEDIAVRLGSRYPHRIVVFDSPPLLLTNESRVLATVVGQILIVVRAGVTPQQAVIEAIGYLSEKQEIGLVLNQSKASGPSSYYGYGTYGYGEYGSDKTGGERSDVSS